MCFDYELTELERNLMKPTKQKKNFETEKLEERPLTVTAQICRINKKPDVAIRHYKDFLMPPEISLKDST